MALVDCQRLSLIENSLVPENQEAVNIAKAASTGSLCLPVPQQIQDHISLARQDEETGKEDTAQQERMRRQVKRTQHSRIG